ncbi:MAG: NIPSNAP family protein [Verrucomicrobia bacterium]|nr:NIPSNAP family protein [Verrucomicrobiota bacterium]
MKTFLRLLLAAALLAGFATAADAKVYELRIYTTEPGRLDALLARFRDHTCKIFEQHGMENIGYWVPLDEDKGRDNTLYYIIAHESRDAAKANWAAFQKDPAWQAARKASEESGKILAKPPEAIFMDFADFSPALKLGAGKAPRVFELRDYTTPDGKVAAIDARFRDHTIKLFEKHGIVNLGYWHPTDAAQGAGSRLIYIVAHPSKEGGLANFKEFGADPDWQAARKASEEKAGGSLTIKGGVKSTYMKAVDFSPIK